MHLPDFTQVGLPVPSLGAGPDGTVHALTWLYTGGTARGTARLFPRRWTRRDCTCTYLTLHRWDCPSLLSALLFRLDQTGLCMYMHLPNSTQVGLPVSSLGATVPAEPDGTVFRQALGPGEEEAAWLALSPCHSLTPLLQGRHPLPPLWRRGAAVAVAAAADVVGRAACRRSGGGAVGVGAARSLCGSGGGCRHSVARLERVWWSNVSMWFCDSAVRNKTTTTKSFSLIFLETFSLSFWISYTLLWLICIPKIETILFCSGALYIYFPRSNTGESFVKLGGA